MQTTVTETCCDVEGCSAVTRAEPDDWGTLYIQIKSQSGILRHMCPECFRPFRDKLHLHGDEESFSI